MHMPAKPLSIPSKKNKPILYFLLKYFFKKLQQNWTFTIKKFHVSTTVCNSLAVVFKITLLKVFTELRVDDSMWPCKNQVTHDSAWEYNYIHGM